MRLGNAERAGGHDAGTTVPGRPGIAILDSAMDVSSAVRAAIHDHGPISFSEFMDISLYGERGFYEDPPVGEGRHFITSPHVHEVFGKLLAHSLRSMWQALASPDPFAIAELGAGDGTLAAQVAGNLDMPFEYLAIEQGGPAREATRRRGIETARIPEDLPQSFEGCVFANELLDNLPFHRVRSEGTDLKEIRVAERAGRFAEVMVPCPERLAGLAPALASGREATIPLAIYDLLDHLASVVQRGYVLFIDYGSNAGEPAGDVHGYRNQRLIEDVLEGPGTADITAGVDFERLAAEAEQKGWVAFPSVHQGDALESLGFSHWAKAELERQTSLLNEGAGLDAVQTWSARNQSRLLVDPRGLGRLQWLLLSTSGLPPPGPPWEATGEKHEDHSFWTPTTSEEP